MADHNQEHNSDYKSDDEQETRVFVDAQEISEAKNRRCSNFKGKIKLVLSFIALLCYTIDIYLDIYYLFIIKKEANE